MPNDFLGAKRLYMSVSRDGRSIEFHGGGENVDEPEHPGLKELIEEVDTFVVRLLHRKVTSICITRCSITDETIKLIANGCCELKEFNVSGCCKLTDESIKAIAEGCPQLKELNVSRCCNLTDESIKAIATHCRGLKELNVSRCDKLNNESIKAIATGCPGLKELNVSYIKTLTDESITAIAQGCPALKHLNASYIAKCGDESIIWIAIGCPKLIDLNVQNTELTDESIKAISRGCIKLTGLNVSCCQKLTDESIKAIAEGCHELKELNVQETHIGDESIMAIAKGCHKLEVLNVQGPNFNDASIKAIGESCHMLKKLSVQGTNLNDESIRAIAKGCPKLNELNISSCQNLTDESIKAIANSCPEVKVLNVSHCRIKDDSIRAFVKGCVLSNLNASHCELTSIPNDIGDRLPELQLLNISNNRITKLPHSVLNLKNLQKLVVSENPLESPPRETANMGMGAIEQFFYELETGSSVSTLLKVVLVGDGKSGKTSLRNALAGRHDPGETHRTIGLEIEKIPVTDGLEANVYDCGGWEENLATQLVYLKGLALYIVVVEAQYAPSVDKKVLDNKLHRFLLILHNRNPGAVVLLPIVTKVDTVNDPRRRCTWLDETIENWLQSTPKMCCARDMPLLVRSRALAVSIVDTNTVRDVRERIIELTRSNLPLRRGVGQQILPAYKDVLGLFGAIARYGDNNRALQALRDRTAPALGNLNDSEFSIHGRYRPKVELENMWNTYCNEPHVNGGDVFDDATHLWEAQGLVVVHAEFVIFQPQFLATLVEPLIENYRDDYINSENFKDIVEQFIDSKSLNDLSLDNKLFNELFYDLATFRKLGALKTSDESLLLSFLWRDTGLKECHHIQVLETFDRSDVIHHVKQHDSERKTLAVVPFRLPQSPDTKTLKQLWPEAIESTELRELKLSFEQQSGFPTGFAERFAADVHGLGMLRYSWRSGAIVSSTSDEYIARAENLGCVIAFSVRFKAQSIVAAWKALCYAHQMLANQRSHRFPRLSYFHYILCEECCCAGEPPSKAFFDPEKTTFNFIPCLHLFNLFVERQKKKSDDRSTYSIRGRQIGPTYIDKVEGDAISIVLSQEASGPISD